MEFAHGAADIPKNCSAPEAPSLAADRDGSKAYRKLENREAPLSGGLPPQEDYFTLSTVMVSPLNLPLIVTSLPAIGVTLAWSAIL